MKFIYPHHIVVTMAALLALSGTMSPVEGNEQELHIGKFSSGDLTGWKEETVWNARKSTYSFIKDNGKNVLMGKSSNAASGLLNKVTLDPKAYPFIRWSWKIDHTVKKANERSKKGHDFAARLYVVFPRGFFSRTRAIEYVWGNVMNTGEILRSPYSDNAVMIAVDSGNEQAGKWVTHKRNYADDYRTLFGEEAPKVGAIAIMTDSDNTGESSVGYFGDIDVLAVVNGEIHNGEAKPKEPLKELPAKQHHQQPDHGPVKEPLPGDAVPNEAHPKEQKKPELPANGGPVPPAPTPEVKPPS